MGRIHGQQKDSLGILGQTYFPGFESALDICSLKDVFKAFSAKLWWQFHTCSNLWTQYMRAKYCNGQISHTIITKPHDSSTWKRIISGRDKTGQQIRWRIGKGELLLWHDAWLDDEPLVNSFPEFSHSMIKVNYFFCENEWDVDKLKSVLLAIIIDEILKVRISYTQEDLAYWALTFDGEFTIKSAWELLRQR
ncbi:Uncharacterized protein TCM_040298 [Theobroma cacao]|uniref:Reverse transcriptase zinc-binding domain-containing protein n=1 Tax=Theobroma cacao TaxID=3641 RepID=A0A061GSL0_THECC|nr:Uncharacterized protein TCM_040298 [Theobroma cacao]